MSRVRFNDVSASYAEQREEIDGAIAEVVKRGDFINGAAVGLLEEEFAKFCGVAHAVGCSNGTSALHLALVAAGIQPGDEVITSAMTFIASSEAISHAGAVPRFADLDPETLNLDSGHAESLISSKTRGLVFVHFHGNPTGIREAATLAERHNLVLIEDCAQAHGALVATASGDDMVHVGRFGAAGCFSFFPAKNLGAFGDAGAVVTNDADRAVLMRRLANHGREEKYRHLVEGWNYRIDTLQAAVLRVKLKNLEAQVVRRNELAALYCSRLSGLPLRVQSCNPAGVRHAYHLFVVETDDRDRLQAHLKAAGIETGIHYPLPLHLQPAYQRFGIREGSLPVAERVARRTLSLPLYPQMPTQDVEYVCKSVHQFFTKA